ncbi:MAG: putative Ig domain-containing protein [Clostridia bacterium]|nr:putative Ig domain-containing protein [Clostridia bacterium]
MKTRKIKRNILRGGVLLSTLAAAALVATPLLSAAPPAVFAEEHEVVGGNYFISDYDTRAEVVAAGEEINAQLVGEGTVLLKNADMGNGKKALPLDVTAENKISLFGKGMYKYGGAPRNGLQTSLRNAGFKLNSAVAGFYGDDAVSGTGAPGYPGNGVVISGLPTGEADISAFSDTSNSISEYNDVAIVGFYRTSGEGFDLPRTMMQNDGDYKKFGPNPAPVDGARAIDDHQLQLDANEAKLLKYCAERFDKVIVLLNSPAPMELGFLDDPDHYAYHENIVGALWANVYTDSTWATIVDILTGKVNPSGHLPDTYARDLKADPTWNNFGENFMENYVDGETTVYAKGNQYANEELRSTEGLGGGGYYSNYVYYKEGIYSGYRYWETRGFTEGNGAWTGTETDVLPHYAHTANEAIHYYSKTSETRVSPGNDKNDKAMQIELDGKTWDNWYNAHVVFPFGYGLSYTEFTCELDEITETLDTNGKITAKVTVTNTGDVAGKDVVQLYYNAPYKAGEIEKAHVKLGAFAKTKLIEPGQSDTVTLEFDVRDMASYDYNDANDNGFKGYELDAGTYNIYIGENAHCWADENVITESYTLVSDVKYETDKVTGHTVENRFDSMSEQLLHEDRYPEDDANNEKDKYMTRNDWVGTYPTLSYRLTAEQWIIDAVKEYNDVFGNVYPEDKPTDPWYNDEMPKTGVKYDTPIKLKELFGLKYDDPKWALFLDQLTYSQLCEIVLKGGYKAGMDIPELGITKAFNEDLPSRVLIPATKDSPTIWTDKPTVWLPEDVMTAASFNAELAYRRGNIMGNISLWGNDSLETHVPGWYAPAVNVHRSPFGGRVGEYMSEDGLLAGKITAGIVRGAQEKGMYCYVKHFAVNSQEINRCGILTWADEQTMREVYFKPFEYAVKEGKTLGIMSSLNRFGPRWAGGSYELLTEVLRDEWGFRGSVVTDAFGAWSNADVMIRTGGSLVLGDNGMLRIAASSATTVNCLRNCAHDILYANANSMAINEGETPTAPKKLREFVGKTLDVGMVNTEYNDSVADCITLNTAHYPDLTADDVTFALAESSTLPRGLTLSADGTISGTPKFESRMTFNVVASLGKEKLTQSFSITIADEGGVIVYDTHEKTLNSVVGSTFNGSVAKARIYDPYATPEDIEKFPPITYSLANGSLLPEGLTLNSNGMISGTPVKECRNYEFTVVASAMGYRDVDCTFTITALHVIDFKTSVLTPAAFGKTYVANIANAECGLPVTYALKEGSELPKGLALTKSGIITGTPTEAVTKTFTVVASNPYALPVETEFTLTVNIKFDSTTELPDGKIGEEYFGSVDTAQGSFGITYSIVNGSLPSGLKLASDGTLSGKPEASGTYTFTVRATDGDLADDITLTLFVDNGGGLTAIIPGGADNGATLGAVGIVLGSIGLAFGAAALVIVLVGKLKKKKD